MIERFHTPSSRSPLRLRVSPYDGIAAVLSPFVALAACLTIAAPSSDTSVPSAAAWTSVAAALAGLLALAVFRVGDGLTRYFSLADAALVTRTVLAAAAAVALAHAAEGSLSPLARDVLILNAAFLTAALLAGRAIARMKADAERRRRQPAASNVLIVGASPLAASYVAMLETAPVHAINVAAIVDTCGKRAGRTLRGVPITGSIATLSTIADEYKIHGVSIDRVLVAMSRAALGPAYAAMLTVECARLGIEPEFLDERLGLAVASAVTESPRADNGRQKAALSPRPALVTSREPELLPGAYHGVRRIIDFAVAAILAIATAPVALSVACLVCVDVGAPVLFWQRRIGKNGRRFLVYKFRTFHAPYDRFGRPRLERAELSPIGRWLRRTRLDELPQLYNVLVGDMALIGPRPLLDVDMPENDCRRLAVRPGLTGWAQVNGGTLLSPEEKNLLDCFYIAHASPLLDAQIALRTLAMMVRGDRGNPAALATARAAFRESEADQPAAAAPSQPVSAAA